MKLTENTRLRNCVFRYKSPETMLHPHLHRCTIALPAPGHAICSLNSTTPLHLQLSMSAPYCSVPASSLWLVVRRQSCPLVSRTVLPPPLNEYAIASRFHSLSSHGWSASLEWMTSVGRALQSVCAAERKVTCRIRKYQYPMKMRIVVNTCRRERVVRSTVSNTGAICLFTRSDDSRTLISDLNLVDVISLSSKIFHTPGLFFHNTCCPVEYNRQSNPIFKVFKVKHSWQRSL